jgi:NADPH:quinone reductase-like Zn-dependent oxidoreductase
MKAIVHTRYGPPEVLQLKEVPKPTPKDDEVLIRITACSLNGSDWEGLVGRPLYARIGGVFRPGRQIPGSDIAGVIESVGSSVQEFRPGDEVFGELPGYAGGLAEYACSRVKTLLRKPAGLSFDQAAAIPQGGTIAYQGIVVKGQVQPGMKVLINGAGGSAGSFAVQLARLHGAEVTGVDNAEKLDFMRSLGADHVLDYTRQDVTRNGEQYDLILDVIARRSIHTWKGSLSPAGSYYYTGGSVKVLFQILLLGGRIKKKTGKNLAVLMVPQGGKALSAITELCENGQVIPVIDRFFPLSEAARAMRYFGEGHAKGKVIVRCN